MDSFRGSGPTGLSAYLEQLQHRTGIRLYVVDGGGRDVLGRELPSEGGDVVAQARQVRGPETGSDRHTGLLVAKPASRADDMPYVFLIQLPGHPSFFFASPYRTLLRVLAAVIVAGVLCYGLARYVTGPLRKLRASARSLAGGDLSTRVGPKVEQRHDEIGDLGQDFNFMAERIESLVSSQQRLILDISHELRSPLARLNLALGLAVQRAGPAATTALDRIGRETERLNDLIERMLVLARLENREAAGKRMELDLAGMLQDITADADFEARGNGRKASLTHFEACTILGIPHLLRSAIENVVRNALRHTEPETQVDISLDVEAAPSPTRVKVMPSR
jgi:two-component system sensor histidine kinase CpxA